jgi:hypothetical protein
VTKALETRLQRLEPRIKPDDYRDLIDPIVVSGKSPGEDDDAFILEVNGPLGRFVGFARTKAVLLGGKVAGISGY